MSLKLGYKKVFLPFYVERERKINLNYHRKGNIGLQNQTTDIYLPMFLKDLLGARLYSMDQASLHWCSRQTKALIPWSLPSRAYHYGEMGTVKEKNWASLSTHSK